MIGQWKAQFRRMMLSPGFETPEEECAAILAKLTADGILRGAGMMKK